MKTESISNDPHRLRPPYSSRRQVPGCRTTRCNYRPRRDPSQLASTGELGFVNPIVVHAHALAHEARVRTLLLLREGPLCACDLAAVLRVEPTSIARHLAVLRRAGLVVTERRGRWDYARVADHRHARRQHDALVGVDGRSGPGPRRSQSSLLGPGDSRRAALRPDRSDARPPRRSLIQSALSARAASGATASTSSKNASTSVGSHVAVHERETESRAGDRPRRSRRASVPADAAVRTRPRCHGPRPRSTP